MKKKWLVHFSAWLGFWGLLVLVRGNENQPWPAVLGSLGLLVLASTVLSTLNYYFLQRYFDQQQFQKYLIGVLVLMLLINGFLYFPLAALQKESFGFFQTLPSLIVNLLLSSGAYFIQNGVRRQSQLQDARAKQLEAEMNLLKMQIQPHFLFNVLNNLYATNLEDHDKANEMILQLADLLRYQLEINKRVTVSLQEEIALTEHYLALEKIRLNNAEVVVTKTGDFAQVCIHPLLLLPLVENAFKHSAGIGKQVIDLKFNLIGQEFVFFCQNSIPTNQSKLVSSQLGLDNVQRRLGAFYPNRHQLSIENTKHNYTLILTLQLDKL